MATCAALPELHPDDRPLDPRAREARHDRSREWSGIRRAARDVDAVLLRSVWDYHLRVDEFLEWVGRFDLSTTFWNSARPRRPGTRRRRICAISRRAG